MKCRQYHDVNIVLRRGSDGRYGTEYVYGGGYDGGALIVVANLSV